MIEHELQDMHAPLEQIMAPFKSPVQLAARRKALVAFDKACKADSRNCYVEMNHISAGD